MKIEKMKNMKGGWFIGDFEPTTYKTKDFEAAVHEYKKGQIHAAHYHAKATEYNYIVSGQMIIQNTLLEPGDIFILYPYEVADPVFLEDCTVVIIKTPSIPGDKYVVEK